MAVRVYDRDGRQYRYSNGRTVTIDPNEGLVVYDAVGSRIAGFHYSGWTSYTIEEPSSEHNVGLVNFERALGSVNLD